MSSPRKTTARAHLAATITEEILNHSSENSFPIESEHELCRRFNISRVTVRLALGDLEARGLIFRKHGKGTFAYGRRLRVRRTIGILIKSPRSIQNWPIAEVIRGAESTMSSLHVNVLLIQSSPQEWSTEMIRDLSGVLVIPTAVTQKDIEFLRTYKKPFLFSWETDLPGPQIDFGQVETARLATEKLLLLGHQRIVLLTGCEESLDTLKRRGVHAAFASVGKRETDLIELSAHHTNIREVAAHEFETPNLSPTAVICCDDHLAIQLIHYLQKKSIIRVPGDLSIVSFHRSPYLEDIESEFLTTKFDFFKAGRQGAEMLNRAALVGGFLENNTASDSALATTNLVKNFGSNSGVE